MPCIAEQGRQQCHRLPDQARLRILSARPPAADHFDIPQRVSAGEALVLGRDEGRLGNSIRLEHPSTHTAVPDSSELTAYITTHRCPHTHRVPTPRRHLTPVTASNHLHTPLLPIGRTTASTPIQTFCERLCGADQLGDRLVYGARRATAGGVGDGGREAHVQDDAERSIGALCEQLSIYV